MKKLDEGRIYAYSYNADNPSICTLLCSTHEIDVWAEIGTVDRQFAQLIVVALNHPHEKMHN